MNSQAFDFQNVMSSSGIRMSEPKEAKAQDISVIRTKETLRKRRSIDWFSY